MNKKRILKGDPRPVQHVEKDREPPRAPARLEGVVRNAGIREKKKRRMRKNKP